MDAQAVLLWLLFQLFVGRSLQDGNLTSSEFINPVLTLSTEVTVFITQGVRQSDTVTLSIPVPSSPSYPTSGLALNSTDGYQQSIASSSGPSNSSTINWEASLSNANDGASGSSHANATLQSTLDVTRIANLTPPVHRLPIGVPWGSIETESTTSDDDSPQHNHTQPDVSQLWIAHQRRNSDRKRKARPRKDEEPPLSSPKASPLPQVGTTALAAGALCLIKLDADRRKKRQKTQEPGAPPPRRAKEAYNMIGSTEIHVSQERLVAEVKGIYAGLVMVEARCIEVDNEQAVVLSSGSSTPLNDERWQALIALHRCLLHEHHDFFLASQHPSASPALRRLASKYAMPARMWRHGIHSFLELLRHRLPHSLDHMVAFIYLAYSMMALLYETVPAFEDTWIECLGDLARYRMAIEDGDTRERETWAGVGRHWYSNASQKAPTTGRLYHHLAILARPNALQQLFLYSKSLCVAIPFHSARESILTLFEPILAANNDPDHEDNHLPALDMAFIKAHGLLYTNQDLESFEPACQDFLLFLDKQISRVKRKFFKDSYHIAIANSAAILGYGSSDNPVMVALKDQVEESGHSPEEILCSGSFQAAQKLAYATLNMFLLRRDDPYILPGIHAFLVFMHYMASHSRTLHFIQADFPWASLADSLNHLLDGYDTSYGIIERENFPIPEGVDARPLPEDFALRGLLWADSYFPNDWFSGGEEDDSDDFEVASRFTMTAQRKERILWLAVSIAQGLTPLQYEPASFDPVHSKFNKPHFIHRGSFSPDESFEDLGASKTALDLEKVSSSSFYELDNDPRLNSIQSTLGLPYDYLKQSAQSAVNAAKRSFERPPPDKEYQESLEDWLSDLINLDMTLDGDDEVGETHGTEVNNATAGTGKNEHLPHRVPIPVDLIVFSQRVNVREDDKYLHHTSESESNPEHIIDDHPEQQDTDGETPSISIPSPKSTPSKLDTSLQAPLTADGEDIPPPEALTKLLDPRTPHDSSQAKSPPQLLSSPSSSSSSPSSQLKSHTCSHCQKAFSRASDMKFVAPLSSPPILYKSKSNTLPPSPIPTSTTQPTQLTLTIPPPSSKHIKYHTRPIACPIQECDYTCGRQRDLIRHQHSVHSDVFGEEEFPCPFEECVRKGKKYKRRDNLGRHLKRRHGDGGGDSGKKGPEAEEEGDD